MADTMDEPLETDHSQNGKIEFHEDSDEVDTSLFLRTKAGIETALPALAKPVASCGQGQMPVGLLMSGKCCRRQKHSRTEKKKEK